MTLPEAIAKYNELALENQEFCDFHKNSIDQEAHISFRNKAQEYRDLTTFLINYQNLMDEKTTVMYITPKMNGYSLQCMCGKCGYTTINRQDDNFCSICGVKFIDKVKTLTPHKELENNKIN